MTNAKVMKHMETYHQELNFSKSEMLLGYFSSEKPRTILSITLKTLSQRTVLMKM